MLFAAVCAIVIPVAVVYGHPKKTPPNTNGAAVLPDAETFLANNGTEWKIQYVGNIGFTGFLGENNLYGDKCRSSTIGGRNIWNCGDMMCADGIDACEFSMGPAFYGTDSVMTINSSAYDNVNSFTFAEPWSGDPKPQAPQSQYGMDTSNVVALNETTGIAYVFEATRGLPGVDVINHGAAAIKVTLGPTQPIATRVGPLMTTNSSVALGLLAITSANGWIYNYNVAGGTGNILVGRTPANDSAFDGNSYSYLTYASSHTSNPKWVPGIPSLSSASKYGMTSADPSGRFNCQVYGDVFWNNYFKQYMLLCTLFLDFTFFYLSPNPWGPWSQGYKLLNPPNRLGYGVSAHPAYSPGGSHRTLYFSQGPNTVFDMYKVSFDY